MEAGEDVARWEGRRKAFRGKAVSKGKRQEQVWQVQGLGEVRPGASCCFLVSSSITVLGLGYRADHSGCTVCSMERVQKRSMGHQVQEPRCPARRQDVTPPEFKAKKGLRHNSPGTYGQRE